MMHTGNSWNLFAARGLSGLRRRPRGARRATYVLTVPVKLDRRQSCDCEIFPLAFGRRPNNNNNTTRSFMRLLLVPNAVVVEIFFQFGRFINDNNKYILSTRTRHTCARSGMWRVRVCETRQRLLQQNYYDEDVSNNNNRPHLHISIFMNIQSAAGSQK